MNWFDSIKTSVLIVLTTVISCRAFAQERELDSVTVVSHVHTSPVKGLSTGTLQWQMSMLESMPQILGNADPLHYTQLLPGVQTASEYDAGLHVQGCDNAHNHISLDGVPIYCASHLFGLFSTFNASHFPTMRFSKSSLHAGDPHRLGGILTMEGIGRSFDCEEDTLKRTLTIGLISSQGTPLTIQSRYTALVVSARCSYMNLLYGPWLKTDEGDEIQYRFGDYNLTWLWQPNKHDRIWLDLYYGEDRANLDAGQSSDRTGMNWYNGAAGLHWNHDLGRSQLEQTLYLSTFSNILHLAYPGQKGDLPSAITDLSYRGKVRGIWGEAGMSIHHYNINPQTPRVETDNLYSAPHKESQHALETSIWAEVPWQFANNWNLDIGLQGSLFRRTDRVETFYALDPSLNLRYRPDGIQQWRLHWGIRHQFLLQNGFSSMGFPTEFWHAASGIFKPQYSQDISLAYDLRLGESGWHLSTESYFKKMSHQTEYTGNLADLLSPTSYSLQSVIREGHGENFGLNIMLNRTIGRWTGWFSYAWGRSLRRFEGENRTFPSSHERIHEMNVVCTLHVGNRWDIGATGVWSTGTPFTAPKHFYMMNGRIVTEYGAFNANRLPSYFRVDSSASYQLRDHKTFRHSMNLSIYNTFACQNTIYYRLKIYQGRYGYRQFRFLARVLPSLSYKVDF